MEKHQPFGWDFNSIKVRLKHAGGIDSYKGQILISIP